jgi:hypothetical protein
MISISKVQVVINSLEKASEWLKQKITIKYINHFNKNKNKKVYKIENKIDKSKINDNIDLIQVPDESRRRGRGRKPKCKK